MKNLESISGNTWRGLSPTAEGVGEFFGFIILFTILVSHHKKIKISNFEESAVTFLACQPLANLVLKGRL